MTSYIDYLPSEMAQAILGLPNHTTVVSADATIDDGYGVPTVTVSVEGSADNRVLHFHFQNLKGQPGTVTFDELAPEQIMQITGPQGPEGPEGPDGPQGPQGEPGTVTFEELTPEQVEMLRGEQGPEGPQGPQGDVGAQGPKGDSYSLTDSDKAEIAAIIESDYTNLGVERY